jgi:hypothetical protein
MRVRDRSRQFHSFRFQPCIGSQQDSVIPGSNHAKPLRGQVQGSVGVSVARFPMLPAIDLDYEPCANAAEIGKVGANWMVAAKFRLGSWRAGRRRQRSASASVLSRRNLRQRIQLRSVRRSPFM